MAAQGDLQSAAAVAAERVAAVKRQVQEQRLAAEEVRVTYAAKLDMVAALQDSWSARASACKSKAALPSSSESPVARLRSTTRGVCYFPVALAHRSLFEMRVCSFW